MDVCYTFHLHDSIVRDVLAFGLLLGLQSSLIVLLRGNYNYGFSHHALERAIFALLCVRVDIGLNGGR
jgi:hypothetical protein